MTMENCPPNCYAKVVEAVMKKQDESTHGKLDIIIGNQTRLIAGVDKVVQVIADLGNLTKQFDKHTAEAEKNFDDLFKRMRKVESRMAWYGGGLSAIVAVFEILRWFHVI